MQQIQRWIRMWCDTQVFRVRMLWLAAEKMYTENAKKLRIARLKNEVRFIYHHSLIAIYCIDYELIRNNP